MNVLWILILAHLFGDFLFQPNIWVKQKEASKLRALQLYMHAIIHGVLVSVLLSVSIAVLPDDSQLITYFSALCAGLIVAIAHLAIDAAKVLLQTERTRRILFFADQALHIFILILLSRFYLQPYINGNLTTHIRSVYVYIPLIASAYFLTQPASIVIRIFISNWTPTKPVEIIKLSVEEKSVERDASLQNAGKYIGIIERLLVFTFILTNHWEAIGFLITAKSIFRFGDLKEAKDINLTEYFLIGTLASFSLAIAVGLIYLNCNF